MAEHHSHAAPTELGISAALISINMALLTELSAVRTFVATTGRLARSLSPRFARRRVFVPRVSSSIPPRYRHKLGSYPHKMKTDHSADKADRSPWRAGLLYQQVLVGIALGILVGFLWPEFGKSLKPLGDGFIKLVKLLISPIIFCTVVHGIASMGDLKRLGRVGVKTLLYFEIVSSLALVIGLLVVNLLKPGAGFNVDVTTLDPRAAGAYAEKARSLTVTDFFLNVIPNTFFEAFVSGDLLQVLLIALLTASTIAGMRER